MPEEQTEFFNEVTDDYPTSYLPTIIAPPFITKLTIKNFKRIEDASILLAKMSVLTGVNNSGKSTILQAIWVAFECLRLCVDRNSWQIANAGRALAGFEFLPANEPQDLWFGRRYRSGNSPRPIRIRIELSDGFFFETQINLYFGAINVKVTDWNRAMGADAIKKTLSLAPMLIPGHVEISPHEESKVPALIQKFAQSGQLSSILRNVLLSLSNLPDSVERSQREAFQFVAEAIAKHFTLELKPVSFDPIRDLEIRATYHENACELDIVAAGT